MPLRICDRIVFGHRLSGFHDKAVGGGDAHPPVKHIQPFERAREDKINIKGLFEVILTLDHNEPRRAAVQAAPAQSGVHSVSQAGFLFQLRKRALHFRRHIAFQRVPLPEHVVHHEADDVLDDPVVPVQAIEQCVVVRHAGEGILCGLQG